MMSAPKDRKIRLYLPGQIHRIGSDGRQTEAYFAECVGHWDKSSDRWVNEAGHSVYPSQWIPV